MKKIDYAKTLKTLYSATSRVKEVNAKKGRFLCVDGIGEPGGPAFHAAIQALYAVAYTLTFMLKAAKVVDFGVSRLEAFWPECDYAQTPETEWRWRVAIRVPDQVTAGAINQARRAIKERKGMDASSVSARAVAEGRALQIMHVGPYGKVGLTYAKLFAYAAANGLAARGAGHEIYVSDPRRVAASKLKTIIRLPVEPVARPKARPAARAPKPRRSPAKRARR